MGGGKSSAPPAPDYTPIAQADVQTAQAEMNLAQRQMDQTQSNFNQEWPYAQQYLQQQTASSAAETAAAGQQQQFYDQNYAPIESQFADEAKNYSTQGRSDQNAAQAMGDVANSFDAARANATTNLESYGIDPSQTRYGALDLGTRISQAAAMAGADTQSRLNTQNTGMALQGEAINIGRGYPSAIAQSYSTATGAGSAGLGAANQTAGTGTAGNAAAGGILGGASSSYGGATGALNAGYSNSLAGTQFNANQSAQMSSGIGSLIGMGMAGGSSTSLIGGALAGL